MEDASLPSDPFDLVGTLIERKYRVDRLVAVGGFGVVYAGHHTGLDLPIAVKVMRPLAAADPDARADAVTDFLREARALSRLAHPAAVGALDAGLATRDRFPEGIPWIVLEWIEGETLQANLAQRRGRGGRSREEALALLRPVFEAIASAHARGICHRDLKPSNVMLPTASEGPASRVLDFGIAKLGRSEPDAPVRFDTVTQARTRAFSAVCAAPEQLSGMRTGPFTDVYALALLVTEVLADAPPYPMDDANARLAAVFDPRRPTPAKLGVDAGAWEPILARALSVHPAARHSDAGALLADLDATLRDTGSSPTLARTSGAPETPPLGFASRFLHDATTGRVPGARRVSRRAGLVMFATLAALSVAALGALSRQARTRSKASPPTAAATRACESNAACGSGREPAVCRKSDGRCVPLASEDCHVLADPGALASDDTVWVGSMFPLSGSDAEEFGRANARAVDLARRDFVQTMGGLAASQAGDAARPIGLVSCDDAVDPRRAAAHLVDVGVPAIIGFRGGVETIDLATTLFLPSHVLSLSTTSTNPLLTRVPEPPLEPRLIWRTTYNSAASAAALAAFTAHVLEPKLRAEGGLDVSERPRVAILRAGNAVGAALADAIVAALHAEPISKAEDREVKDFPFDPDAPVTSARYVDLARDLGAFAPHVVLLNAGRPVIQGALVPLEAEWPRPRRFRPRYLSIATIGSNLFELVGRDADLRRRVFGATPIASSPAGARFVTHYREAFPDDGVTPTNAPDTAYDAFYLLAYATYALPPGADVRGPALSEAFGRLTPTAPPAAPPVAPTAATRPPLEVGSPGSSTPTPRSAPDGASTWSARQVPSTSIARPAKRSSTTPFSASPPTPRVAPPRASRRGWSSPPPSAA